MFVIACAAARRHAEQRMTLKYGWPIENVLMLLFSILTSLSVGLLLNQWFVSSDLLRDTGYQNFISFLIGVLSLHGASAVCIWMFLRKLRTPPDVAFGLRAPRIAAAVSLAVLVAIVTLPLAWFLGEVSASFMSRLGVTPQEQMPVTALRAAVSMPQRVVFAIVVIGVVPIVEEALFRGILYPAAKAAGFPRLALWGTALLFAAVHGNLMTLIPLLFLAVMLSLLYEQTGNLLAPILTHSLFNAANYSWLIAQQGAQS
jgi:membrane protease YdiL (CAAX protease family)